jgi:hypothetical protein
MLTRIALAGIMTAFAATAAAWGSSVASAQYPPPEGSCSISTSATTTTSHGSVGVTVTVLDINGKPVAGVLPQVSISRQPGGDAAISNLAAPTDANGSVHTNLGAGGTPGVVGLSAHTDVVSCAASVVVEGGVLAAEVSLPDTGSGSTSHGDSLAAFAAFVLAIAGVAAIAFATSRREPRDQ